MEQEAVPGMPETFPDVMVEVPKILRYVLCHVILVMFLSIAISVLILVSG